MISLRGLLYYTIGYLTIGILMEFLIFFRIILFDFLFDVRFHKANYIINSKNNRQSAYLLLLLINF